MISTFLLDGTFSVHSKCILININVVYDGLFLTIRNEKTFKEQDRFFSLI